MGQWMGSLFWILIGAGVAFHSWRLGLGRLHQPGPGFVFFVTALLLIILGSIDLAVSRRRKSGPEQTEEGIRLGPRWKKVVLVLAALSIYGYFFEIVGFYPSTFILMVFLFRAVDPTKWVTAIVASGITIAISYGVFEMWLQVPFPRGILEF